MSGLNRSVGPPPVPGPPVEHRLCAPGVEPSMLPVLSPGLGVHRHDLLQLGGQPAILV